MYDSVLITDVAPRDGLQNEPEVLHVAIRAELVQRLLAAGVPRVELGSFVNPKQVPQMAGTDVVAAVVLADPANAARVTALVPNMRGYELARATGLRHVRLVLAASEALNQANFKRSVAESLADFATIAAQAQADGLGFGVAIGASFGCPFEGHVPPARVLEIAAELLALGADEVGLADTTGMAVPTQVAGLCQAALPLLAAASLGRDDLDDAEDPDGGAAPWGRLSAPTLTVHLHNTRNTGYANALAAWQVGVRSFDASLGGIGGCPFAPRAVGNIGSEDLVHMLNGMGVPTGIDLSALVDSSHWLSQQMGKPLPALVGKAAPVYAEVRNGA